MTYYERKRRKTRLTRSDIANQLGIDYDRYVLIERGNVKMPMNLIDKFNKVINKSRGETTIEQMNREQLVDEWWNRVTEKNEYDRYNIYKEMERFNIRSFGELAQLLGYSNSSCICSYISGSREPSYDTKNRIYSFFENELNIQPLKTKEERIKSKKIDEEYAKLLKWYEDFDLSVFMSEYNLTGKQIREESGISCGLLDNFKNKRAIRPTKNSLIKLKRYVDKLDSNIEIEEEQPTTEKSWRELNDIDIDEMVEKYKEDYPEEYEEAQAELNEAVDGLDRILKMNNLKKYIEWQLMKAKADVINYENMLKILGEE